MTFDAILTAFEAEYGPLHGKLRKKLEAIRARESAEFRRGGYTLLALKAFPSSPMQRLFQQLHDNA